MRVDEGRLTISARGTVLSQVTCLAVVGNRLPGACGRRAGPWEVRTLRLLHTREFGRRPEGEESHVSGRPGPWGRVTGQRSCQEEDGAQEGEWGGGLAALSCCRVSGRRCPWGRRSRAEHGRVRKGSCPLRVFPVPSGNDPSGRGRGFWDFLQSLRAEGAGLLGPGRRPWVEGLLGTGEL